MPWVYDQRWGRLWDQNGRKVTTGAPGSGYRPSYSGSFRNANYLPAQGLPLAGPIQVGSYRIECATRDKGYADPTMDLIPIGHSALVPTHLMIRGCSESNPGNASVGCTIEIKLVP